MAEAKPIGDKRPFLAASSSGQPSKTQRVKPAAVELGALVGPVICRVPMLSIKAPSPLLLTFSVRALVHRCFITAFRKCQTMEIPHTLLLCGPPLWPCGLGISMRD